MHQHSRLIPEHMTRTGVAYSSHLPTKAGVYWINFNNIIITANFYSCG